MRVLDPSVAAARFGVDESRPKGDFFSSVLGAWAGALIINESVIQRRRGKDAQRDSKKQCAADKNGIKELG